MSKKRAMRELKRRRMQSEVSYTFHLVHQFWQGQGALLEPAFKTYYAREARKAHYRKELVRP